MGLINVEAAWDLLKTNIKTVDITGTVPTNTILSGFLSPPGVGTGIYDREGVNAGESYTRTYTFTRNDGPGGAVTYNVGWVGNDGTFSAPSSISLGKGSPATLVVSVNPTAGDHSAILTLDDPSTTGIDYATMNTVIAPMTFSAATTTRRASRARSRVDRRSTTSSACRTGAPAFKVDLNGGGDAAGAGAIRFLRWHPFGQGVDSNAVSNCYNGAPGGCTTGSRRAGR
jgi:hypothetical protein